jgi:hypothetical protein
MPKPDAAAVRADLEYEGHFGVPEESFVEPNMPAIITEQYRPLLEAVRQSLEDQAEYHANCGTGCWWYELRAALRAVVGEDV